jgi:SAM-dependent methyltransferase
MVAERFAADWLSLREPVDHRSRDTALVDRLADHWHRRGGGTVVDLGSGTGSNFRYLAPRLAAPQRWVLVDHDAGLLARARPASGGPPMERVCADLFGEGLDVVRRSELMTASALLDLVSADWLQRLVAICRARGCAAYLALSYDGTIGWGRGGAEEAGAGPGIDAEIDADGALVVAAVNDHQRRDKGFGPALGPTAATAAEALFREAGFRTWSRPSPWHLDGRDADLAGLLLQGWLQAACEQRPAEAARIRAWGLRQQQRIGGGDFHLTVGHQDLLALPTDGPPAGSG